VAKADGWHPHARGSALWRRGVWLAVVYPARGGWYWHRFGDRHGPLASEAAARQAADPEAAQGRG